MPPSAQSGVTLADRIAEVGVRKAGSGGAEGTSGGAAMKPAVDEMFPEGAGPYVDLDEVRGVWSELPARMRAAAAAGFLGRGGAVLPGRGLEALSACFPRQGEARGC